MQDITQYKKELETTILNKEHIKRTLQLLIDNGIDEYNAGDVLQAIGYTLLDTELDCEGVEIAPDGNLIYWENDIECIYI